VGAASAGCAAWQRRSGTASTSGFRSSTAIAALLSTTNDHQVDGERDLTGRVRNRQSPGSLRRCSQWREISTSGRWVGGSLGRPAAKARIASWFIERRLELAMALTRR
jgi:hypothetical protein